MKDYSGWEIVEDKPANNYSGWEVVGDDSSMPEPATGAPQEFSFNPQFSKIFGDALNGLAGIPGNLIQGIASAPEFISQLNSARKQSPLRAGQNLVAGVSQLGNSLGNIPSNVAGYAADTGFIPQGWADAVPRRDGDDYAAMVGLSEQQEGDSALQAFGRYGPLAATGFPLTGVAAESIGSGRNPIESVGTLLAPQFLGKAAGAVKQAGSRTNVAKGLVGAEKAAKSSASQQYTSIFNTAEQAGAAKNLKAPKVDIKTIKKGSPDGKFVKALEEARNSPTLENINQAQSAMGKFIRSNQDKPNLSPTTIKALHEANKAQQQYKDTLYRAFEKAGKPELINDYAKANEFYRTDVVPYARSKPLQEFKRGERTAPGLVKTLARSDKFKAQLAKKHPEVQTSHALNAFGKLDPFVSSGKAGLDLLAKILKGDKK